ncbi:MAG: zinc-ribbon domain-containing protein [Candidatus Thorarchaeota archaeon]|nr:MAG: zinc-ribbon domain-containing protein [Candidatus Thorarchaeota archaeon]
MVYCQSCGQENSENATFCSNCGAAIREDAPPPAARQPKKPDEECFGLPYGDAICGVVFGSIIIISGLAYFFGWDFSTLWETTIGPYLIILFGALIILGAIYSSTTKSRRVRC